MNLVDLMTAHVFPWMPDATFSVDDDGQFTLHTGLRLLTPEDNPSIPEGETLLVPFEDENECANGCVDPVGHAE